MEQDKAVVISNVEFMVRSLTRYIEDIKQAETEQDFYNLLVDYGLILKYYSNPVNQIVSRWRSDFNQDVEEESV